VRRATPFKTSSWPKGRRRPVKIATFNVSGINGRPPCCCAGLAEAGPDVVYLQELKAQNQRFSETTIREAGYGAIW
jgi:exodeoxyribonuclease III